MLLAALVLLVFLPSTAQAQPTDALQVEADTVVYDQLRHQVEATGSVRSRYRGIVLHAEQATFDLAQEKLTARGRVRLIDAQGRELRDEVITYDVRLSLAEVQRGESIVDRVYIRSETLQATPAACRVSATARTRVSGSTIFMDISWGRCRAASTRSTPLGWGSSPGTFSATPRPPMLWN